MNTVGPEQLSKEMGFDSSRPENIGAFHVLTVAHSGICQTF